MKMRRIIKCLMFVLVLIFMFELMPFGNNLVFVNAEENTSSDPGTEGNPWLIGKNNPDDVKAWLTGEGDNKTLHISGIGDMKDFKLSDDPVPWKSERNNISNVDLQDGVTSIGAYTFYCMLIESLTIPSSINKFGYWSLVAMMDLKEINVDSNNLYFSSEDGVLFDKNKTTLIRYPSAKEGKSYTIPQTVTVIDEYSFEFNYLEEIIIPNGVKEISDYAFDESQNIESVNIPSSVTKIGDFIFKGCKQLNEIYVDSGNLYYSSEDGVLFNEDKTVLILYPYNKSGNYSIPDGVEELAKGAFWLSDKWLTLFIPSSLRSFDNESFAPGGHYDITYAGTVSQWFSIDGRFYTKNIAVKDVTIHCSDRDVPLIDGRLVEVSAIQDQEYTGAEIHPEFTCTFDGITLVEGLDYNVDWNYYSDLVSTGNKEFKMELVGNGEVFYGLFRIIPRDISDAVITLDNKQFKPDGSVHTVNVEKVVLSNGLELKSDDYDVSGDVSGTDEKTYTVTITGKGNFTGSASTIWFIGKVNPEVTKPTAKSNLVYNGKSQTLIDAGSTTGGTMYYAVTASGSSAPTVDKYSPTIPKETNAGSYYVWYKSVGNDYYFDSEPGYIVVKIGEAPAGGNKSDADKDNKKDNKNDNKSKYSNEWVDGKWYNADGICDYAGTLSWKNDETGWWVEDSEGWYPVAQWQKIDGKWYYFDASGYMASNEWVDGCWLGGDGAWEYQYVGSWKTNGSGWWFEDESGWYPSSQWQRIDGKWYYFGSDGIMLTNQYVGDCWVGSDGSWQ